MKTGIMIKHFLYFNVWVYSTCVIDIGVATITQVTHVRNKNSNIQGRSLNVIKVSFHTIMNCS